MSDEKGESVNRYEALSRERKACTLADTLQRHGITAAEAEAASDSDWELACKAAGTRLPSAETRRIVVQMLRSREPQREAVGV